MVAVEEHSPKIDVQNPVPQLRVCVEERSEIADTGVVDQDVDALPALAHGGHDSLNRVRVGHVAFDCERFAALAHDLSGRPFGTRPVEIDNRYPSTLVR